jgi:hypothetical protein
MTATAYRRLREARFRTQVARGGLLSPVIPAVSAPALDLTARTSRTPATGEAQDDY